MAVPAGVHDQTNCRGHRGLSISYDITQPCAGTIEFGSAIDGFTEFIVQPAVQPRLGTTWQRGVSSL
jgi:hypothetical protein